MKVETKIETYRKIYNEVKNSPDVTDVNFPEEKENLDFYGKMGDFNFEFSLKANMDMLKLVASGDFIIPESKLLQYGDSLTKDEKGIMFTTYDQHVIFQLTLPLTGMEDSAAEKMAINATRRFVEFMKKAVVEMKELKSSSPSYSEERESVVVKEETDTSTTLQSAEKEASEEMYTEEETTVAEKQGDPEEKTDENDISGNDVTEESNEKLEPDTKLDEPEIEQEKDESTEAESELDAVVQEIPYVQAPEVKQQMVDMYDTLDRTFAKKKEQIAFREELLKKQKAILEDEKKQLQNEKDRIVAEKEELKSERDRIENDWISYNAADNELRSKQQSMKEQEKKYRESEKFFRQKEQSFQSQNKNLENRIASVNARSKAIKDKEKRLDAFEQSLKRREHDIQERLTDVADKESALKIKEKDLHLKEEQILMENDAIAEKTADLKELEAYVSQMEKAAMPVDVDAYEKQIQDLSEKLDTANGKIVDLSDNAQTMLINLNQEKASAEKEKELHLKSQERISSLEKEMQEKENSFQEEMKKQKDSYAQLDDLWKQSEARAKDLDERIEKYEREEEEKLTPDKVLSELESIGITAKRMPSENEGLISCEVDGCKVVFDVSTGMLCVSKSVRKKYAKDLVAWNNEDITASYFQDKTMMYCKKRFFKTSDYRKAVDRLHDLK